MKINLLATGVDLTPSLRAYVEEKLGGIARFIKKYEREGEIVMAVEIARTTRHHHRGDVFRAEVNLDIPKHVLRAVESADDARKAIDLARNTLRLEVEKYKTRTDDRRAARRARRG